MDLHNTPFDSVSPCEYADALPRKQFMHYAIKPLWEGMPRIAGPAFTVKCEPGDHLMLHAAIYRASVNCWINKRQERRECGSLAPLKFHKPPSLKPCGSAAIRVCFDIHRVYGVTAIGLASVQSVTSIG